MSPPVVRFAPSPTGLRALFHLLQLALTAQDNGPEMASLLPLIGRAKAEARLQSKTA